MRWPTVRAATEVVPGLYRLLGTLLGVNAYVWHPNAAGGSPDEPVLFDCGWPWLGPHLTTGLVEAGCRPQDIRSIAITHHDLDHTGRLASLQAVSGADVYAHEMEAPRIGQDVWRQLPCQEQRYHPVGNVASVLELRWPCQPSKVTRVICDGDQIPGGWLAVHTPGHTPGHTSYFNPALQVLIAGDALGPTVGRGMRVPHDVYSEDPAQAVQSICKLAELEPKILCFGHGPVLRDAAPDLRRFADALQRRQPRHRS
jgi:glyoxylase-like metal-dependent hydrolase (beta-lactamase superfamily II)